MVATHGTNFPMKKTGVKAHRGSPGLFPHCPSPLVVVRLVHEAKAAVLALAELMVPGGPGPAGRGRGSNNTRSQAGAQEDGWGGGASMEGWEGRAELKWPSRAQVRRGCAAVEHDQTLGRGVVVSTPAQSKRGAACGAVGARAISLLAC